MIFVVLQDSENSYWSNRYDSSYLYEDMIIYEMVPLIDKILHTKKSSANRAIIGYSMGVGSSFSIYAPPWHLWFCSRSEFFSEYRFRVYGNETGYI